MADGDRNPEFVGQHLQFPLPQAQTHAVAAAAIGGNQQPRRDRIAGDAELIPPAADAFDGERRRVVADGEIDPSDIVSNVVDAVRGMTKSCTRTGSGCPLGRSSRPAFLKSPTQRNRSCVQRRLAGLRVTHICRFVRCVFTANPILFFRFGCPGSGPKHRKRRQLSTPDGSVAGQSVREG